MTPLLALVLVCGLATAPEACSAETALDVIATPVRSPMECLVQGQAMAAGAGLPGEGRYLKVRCQRRKGDHAAR